MKKAIYAYLLFQFLFFNIQAIRAQADNYNNIAGVDMGGGVSTMLYNPEHGSCSISYGYSGELHYTYFSGKYTGFGFGIRYTLFQATSIYNFTETTTGLSHPDNPNIIYDLNTTFTDWKERQILSVLSIPIEVKLRHPLNRKNVLVGGFGFQFDIPLHGKYIADGGSFSTSGYFPTTGHTLYNQPQHGFGTYGADEECEMQVLNVGMSVLADIGLRTTIGKNSSLYFGLYASFGMINCVNSTNGDPLLVLDPSDPTQSIYNGSFASREVNYMRLFSAGATVGIDFGWLRKKHLSKVHRRTTRHGVFQ